MEYTTNFNLAKPEGTNTADISVLNGNMDIIDENMVKTYSFDFDLVTDGVDYTATPHEGVTYQAMIDALTETPNVYFRLHFTQLSEMLYIRVNNTSAIDTTIRGSILVYMNLNPTGTTIMRFVAARMAFYGNNSTDIVLQPLENYTP